MRIWITVLIHIIGVVLFSHEFVSHMRALLWISYQFPQIKTKPLLALPEPSHTTILYSSGSNAAVADIYTPNYHLKKYPVLIMAIGVRLSPQDHAQFLKSSKNISRLGYIVIWPRSIDIEQQKPKLEDPRLFIDTYKKVRVLPFADRNRISIVGFSTGASLATVALEQPELVGKIRTLVFFGGYFDILTYYNSLRTHTICVGGKPVAWYPRTDVVDTMHKILTYEGSPNISTLSRYSPAAHIDRLVTPIFIIHDRNDTVIPYIESVNLYSQIPKNNPKHIIITTMFNHVHPQPKNLRLWDTGKLYWFFYQTIKSL